MDPLTTALGLMFVVIALNHAVMRIEGLNKFRALYVAIQCLNVSMAVGILIVGVPGLESLPLARYILSMLFVFRLVMNFNERQNQMQDDKMAKLWAEQERIREQIQAGEVEPEER
jgi:hypothetical protein